VLANMSRESNPSGWSHRLPVLVLALTGYGISAYLALYQLHVFANVWDPLFGSAASSAVLTSTVSKALPLPDASLGAAAYAAEALVTCLGPADRWRTAPWTVLLFGVVAGSLALASMVLIGLQLGVVGHGCALCLTSAAISLLNAWLARREVLATVGLLRHARRGDASIFRTRLGAGRGY
jgi:uncharacterized membrane protein